MSKIKIIVCCHKDDIKASSEVYMPLHVGKAISDKDLGIACDNTGDNISNKNESFCELTGLYWAWKNLKDVDYVGLCHYRRYFDFHQIGRKYFPFTTFPTESFSHVDLSIPQRIENLLDKGCVVLPKAWSLRYSVYMEYCEHHYSKDFRILGDVIKEMSPAKYIQAFNSTMLESNKLVPLNMFIMSREQLNNYCSWLFPILFELESRIDISNYDPVQKRIFGYLGERLLNVYVAAEKIKHVDYPILKFSEESETFNQLWYKYKLRCWMNSLAVKLSNY